MKLELDYDFLRDARVPLDSEDLRLGVSLGLISPTTAVAVAVDAVDRGTDAPTMLGLAQVDRDDIAAVLEHQPLRSHRRQPHLPH